MSLVPGGEQPPAAALPGGSTRLGTSSDGDNGTARSGGRACHTNLNQASKGIRAMASKHGSPWLEREDFGDVTVVRLKLPPTLDDDTTRAAFDAIYSLVEAVGRTRLVLNVAAAPYLPSMALGKLVLLSRKVQAGNGRLVLCHLTPPVEDLLETTRLRDLFAIHATEQEAVRSFSQQLRP